MGGDFLPSAPPFEATFKSSTLPIDGAAWYSGTAVLALLLLMATLSSSISFLSLAFCSQTAFSSASLSAVTLTISPSILQLRLRAAASSVCRLSSVPSSSAFSATTAFSLSWVCSSSRSTWASLSIAAALARLVSMTACRYSSSSSSCSLFCSLAFFSSRASRRQFWSTEMSAWDEGDLVLDGGGGGGEEGMAITAWDTTCLGER